jgi:hypothetical protein
MLSETARITAGAVLLTVVTIEYGGTFLLRIARGHVPATDLQKTFFRAGHAHAGVLVILGLLAQVLTDSSGLTGFAEVIARDGPLLAAILLPAGFFLSVVGKNVTRPNRLIILLWLGAVSLTAGVVTLGVGLLTA